MRINITKLDSVIARSEKLKNNSSVGNVREIRKLAYAALGCFIDQYAEAGTEAVIALCKKLWRENKRAMPMYELIDTATFSVRRPRKKSRR